MSPLCLQSPAGPTDWAVLGRGPANSRVGSRRGNRRGARGQQSPRRLLSSGFGGAVSREKVSSGVFEGRSHGYERAGPGTGGGVCTLPGQGAGWGWGRGDAAELLLPEVSSWGAARTSPFQVLPFHPHPLHWAAKDSWRVGSFVGSRWLTGLGQPGADGGAPGVTASWKQVSSARLGSRAQRRERRGLGPSPWGRWIPAPQRCP